MSRGTVIVQIGRSLKINTDQKLSLKNKNQSNKVLLRNISRKLDDRISIKTKKLTTPASLRVLLPLLKVEARVEEQDSSYPAVWPSLVAELMEMVHILAAYPSQLQSSSAPPSPDAHT